MTRPRAFINEKGKVTTYSQRKMIHSKYHMVPAYGICTIKD